jgi:spore coat protein CotH
LNFSKFVEGQKFHGLKRIHLNNSVQDPQLHGREAFAARCSATPVCRRRACPGPTVAINGKPKGLYVLKEGFTKDMLGLYFKNTRGNLYDGGFLHDITEPLEKDMGDDDVNDRSDLKALVKAAQEPDAAKRFEALSQVLDVDRFISFAALEIMMWDWDGYIMNKNNYRVYHDLDTGKMVFFPHGMDQMFENRPSMIFPPNISASLVGRALLKTTRKAASSITSASVSFTRMCSGSRCSPIEWRNWPHCCDSTRTAILAARPERCATASCNALS